MGALRRQRFAPLFVRGDLLLFSFFGSIAVPGVEATVRIAVVIRRCTIHLLRMKLSFCKIVVRLNNRSSSGTTGATHMREQFEHILLFYGL